MLARRCHDAAVCFSTETRTASEGSSALTAVFHRPSRRKAVQRTDGYRRLVFTVPRSVTAFPTPLRQIIGRHWPWYRLAGANCFYGSQKPPSATKGANNSPGSDAHAN